MATCKKPPPPLSPYHSYWVDLSHELRKGFGAEKFYARHEAGIMKYDDRVAYYEDFLDKYHKFDAREHYKKPRYTNQEYGWNKGKKVMHYQYCEINIRDHPCITEIIKKVYDARDSRQMDAGKYCHCKEWYNKDHWKIV